MQILCKFYANFIAISLFCGLLAINVPAWAQLYAKDWYNNSSQCGLPKDYTTDYVFGAPPEPLLEHRIDSSAFVFKGKIIKQRDLWHNNRKYECYTVAVYQIFKGDFVADTVEVLSYYGYDMSSDKLQRIGAFSIREGVRIFFVVPTLLSDNTTPSGRLRFQAAFVRGSSILLEEASYWSEFCEEITNKNGQHIISCDKLYDRIKKYTGKCTIVANPEKKKLNH
jgi:hypothetical protein